MQKMRQSYPGGQSVLSLLWDHHPPRASKRNPRARGLMLLSVSTAVAVIAVLVCVVLVIRRSDPGRDVTTVESAPLLTTVSTLSAEPSAEISAETSAEISAETSAETFAEETRETDYSDPWIHVDTMEDAEKALGFGLEPPELVKDFEKPWINIAPDCSNLWVSYHQYAQEHDPMYYDKIITVGRSIYIVKYPCPDGSIFVSPETKQKLIKVDGHDVVLEMEGNEVIEADWAADGYAYSLSFENMGLTAYTVVSVISQTH